MKQTDALEMILQAGYDINATDFDGNDALFFAAIQNQQDTVERIIKFSKHDKQHLIDTYELLGATLIDKEQHTDGLKYWQKAMGMRFEDKENPIRKADVEHTLVFHGVQEPMALDDPGINEPRARPSADAVIVGTREDSGSNSPRHTVQGMAISTP